MFRLRPSPARSLSARREASPLNPLLGLSAHVPVAERRPKAARRTDRACSGVPQALPSRHPATHWARLRPAGPLGPAVRPGHRFLVLLGRGHPGRWRLLSALTGVHRHRHHEPGAGPGLGGRAVSVREVETFQTPRLVARPVARQDVDFLERMWGDERVARTIGGVRDRAQILRKIELALDHWEEHGFGRWIVTYSDESIGTVKLETWLHDGQSEIELGFSLRPDCGGRGYATEAAASALAQATLLGLRDVVAGALVTNPRSLAVLRRLGFHFERKLLLEGSEHALYRRRV